MKTTTLKTLYIFSSAYIPSVYMILLSLVFLLSVGSVAAQNYVYLPQCSGDDCGAMSFDAGPAAGSSNTLCQNEIFSLNIDSIKLDATPISPDSIKIFWGDGTSEIAPSEGVYNHAYTFTEEEILQGSNPLGQTGIEVRVIVYESCNDGLSCATISTFLTVQFLPIVGFGFGSISDTICQNDPVCISDSTFFADDYIIDFGDGNTTNNPFACNIYNQVEGIVEYNVTMTASNECGVGYPSSSSNSSDNVTVTNQITVVALPDAQIGLPAELQNDTIACAGEITFQNNSDSTPYTYTDTYYWEVYQNNNQTPIVVDTVFDESPFTSNYSPGVYEIVLIGKNERCDSTVATFEFAVEPSPDAIIIDPATICTDDFTDYSPTVNYLNDHLITFYSWTFENGTPATSSDAHPTGITFPPGQHNINLTIGSDCGDSHFSTSIYIKDPSVVTFPPLSNPYCDEADTIDITPTPSGGSWDFHPAIVGDTAFVPAFASPGITTLTYTADACTPPVSIDIEILPPDPVIISPIDTIVCEDADTFSFSASVPGGTWSGDGIIDSNTGLFDPTIPTSNASTMVTYSFIGASGCENESSTEVFIAPLPVANLSADTLIFCETPGDIDLNAELNIFLFGGYTGEWIGNCVDAAGTLDPICVGVDTVDLQYVVSSPYSCTDTADLAVVVLPFEQVTVGQDTSICFYAGETFTLTPPSIPRGLWSGINVNPSTGVITMNNLMSGPYTYTYTVFAGTTCESSASVQVDIVNLNPVSAPDLSFCETDGTITLPDGTPSGGIWVTHTGDTLIGNNLNVDSIGPGDYVFQYKVESPADDEMCREEDDVDIFIDALPVIDVIVPEDWCVDVPQTITNNTPYFYTSWEWDFGDGTTSNAFSPQHEYSSTGYYDITLVVTDTVCTKTFSWDSVHVSAPPPPLDFEMTLSREDSCETLMASFINTSDIDTNITDLTYIWIFGFNGLTDTTYSIDEVPMDVFYEAYENDTTYYITLKAESPCGAADNFARDSVYVKPRPMSAFGPQFDTYCSGAVVSLINSSQGNPINTTIDLGDGSDTIYNYPHDTLTHQYWAGSEPDTFVITFSSTNECGGDTIRDTIEIIPVDVIANFTTQGSGTFCVGLPLCVENNATPGAEVYYDFGDGALYYEENPCHTYAEAGSYTITQYASDICGGFDTMQTQITVLDEPDVGMDFPPVNCVNTDIEFTGIADASIFNVSWDFGDGGTSQALNPTYAYSTPGTYDVVFSVSSIEGCYADTLASITILPEPNPIMSFDDSLCVGETATLQNLTTGNISSCLWTIDGSISLAACDTSYSFTTSGIHNLQLQITDQNGCTNSKDTVIYVRPTPAAQFDIDTLDYCHPAEFSFINNSTESNTATWDFGDGSPLVQGDSVSVTHTYSQPGDYDVILYASFDGICEDTDTQTITVHPTPEAIIQIDNTEGCEPFIPQIQNLSVGDNLAFAWEIPQDGFANYNTTFTHTLYADNPSSIYDIILVVNDTITGCSDTTMMPVTVFDSIELTLAQDSVTCFGGNDGQAFVSITGGSPGYQYDWSNGSVLDSTDLVSAGMHSVTVEDANGCTQTDSIRVEEPDLIVVTDSITNVTCLNGDDGAISVTVTGGTAPYLYNWSNGSNQPDISNLTAGDYDLTVTDSKGCSHTYTYNVPTTNNFPIASMTIDQQTGCEPLVPTISFTGAGDNLEIVWDLGDGNIEYDNSIIQPVFTTEDAESTYSIVLTVTDEVTGCFDTDTMDVTVYDQLLAYLSYDPLLCHGDTTTLEAVVSGGNGNYAYDWTPNIGNTSTIEANTGDYSVSISDTRGCSISLDTFISQPTPVTIALDSSSNATCEGWANAYLEIAAFGGTTNTGSEYSYTWNADDATPGGPELTDVSSGTYTVTVTDQNGCTAEESFELLNGVEILADLAVEGITCEGDTDGNIYVENIYNGVPPYEGSIEGARNALLVSNSGNMRFSDLPQGEYELLLVDSNGCEFENMVNVPGWVDPVVSILPDTPSIYLCQDLTLRASYLASGATENISVEWSPDVWTSCLECDTVVVSPRQNQNYTVKVTDEHGCIGTAEKPLQVIRDETLYVPNTFTPNGDGFNDIFRIRVGEQQEFYLESVTMFNVLDQWGNVLYSAEKHHPFYEPNIGWDGKMSDIDVPPGRYMYVIEYLDCEGEKTLLKGAIDLIR